MRTYIGKRLFLMIPSLLFVVLLSFILLHYAPGDPVETILNGQGIYTDDLSPGKENEVLRDALTKKLGLNLPLFYFSVSGLSSGGWKEFVPAISFHSDNQFHRWFFGDGINTSGIIRGDFGSSWITNEKISSIIFSRIGWSLLFSLLSVILAYYVSIRVALFSASNPGSLFNKWTNGIFTFMFSLPAFWIASLLMLLFCNPEVLNILPASGVRPPEGFPENSSASYRFFHVIPYLVLPTFCYTYSSIAFLSGSIRSSVTEALQQDYIRTARAKGLDRETILHRHALRNALLPMITIFSQAFPFAIGGSVILETVFTIPGMGLATFQAISGQDYPVVIAVFMITGIITMLSFLLSDILYAFADPRISYSPATHE